MSDVGKALKIIPRKIKKALKTPNEDYTIHWDAEDPLQCYFWFHLREGPYSGSNHILHINFKGSRGYFPFFPPSAKFITPPFHTNVYQGGSICVNIFSDDSKWSPENGIECIANNMILLFNDQNVNSPANGEAGRLFAKCNADWKTYQKEHMKANKVPPKPSEQDKFFEPFKKQVISKSKSYKLAPYFKMFPGLEEAVKK